MIIAIDGPAGAGKGTIARFLAQQFALFHLDSGLLYRAVAEKTISEHIAPDALEAIIKIAASISLEDAKSSSLRSEEVANRASVVGTIPEVRHILTTLMRKVAAAVPAPYKGIVIDGRDIGTVVLPQATYKFFVTASEEVRLSRRQAQLLSQDRRHLKALLAERDNRDMKRTTAPLVAPKDAFVLDTTSLSVEEVYQMVDKLVKSEYFSPQVA